MIRHENNDPRRPQREAAEKARRDRTTRWLMVAVGILSGAVALMLLRGWGLLG